MPDWNALTNEQKDHIIFAAEMWSCQCTGDHRQMALDMFNAVMQAPDLLSSLPELVRLREALELCMVGGNHLATLLIGSLGASFSSDYPPGSNHEEVRAALALQSDYEAWCCWNAIMRARSALEAGK